MIHVSNRPNVDVGLVTLEFLFAHGYLFMAFGQQLTRIACGEARPLKK
jgi:hypothetical protein